MLYNQIGLPTDFTLEVTKINTLRLLAFTEDFTSNNYQGTTTYIVKVAYLPEGVPIVQADGGYGTSDFVGFVTRQDAKSVPIVPLSKATFHQGMIINETAFGQSAETYFLNSITIYQAGQTFRLGVSNFTQTLDNNPFTALTSSSILYYDLEG